MTNVFAVAGEHARDPRRLLLVGEDGRYYTLSADGRPTPLDSMRDWRLDIAGDDPGKRGAIPAKPRRAESFGPGEA